MVSPQNDPNNDGDGESKRFGENLSSLTEEKRL